MKMPARVRPATHFDDASFRPDEEGIEGGIDISLQMPSIAILWPGVISSMSVAILRMRVPSRLSKSASHHEGFCWCEWAVINRYGAASGVSSTNSVGVRPFLTIMELPTSVPVHFGETIGLIPPCLSRRWNGLVRRAPYASSDR